MVKEISEFYTVWFFFFDFFYKRTLKTITIVFIQYYLHIKRVHNKNE